MYVLGVLIVLLIAVSIWFPGTRSTDAVISGIGTLPFVLSLVIGLIVSDMLINGVGWFTPVFCPPVGGGLVFTFAVDNPTRTWDGYESIRMGQGMQLTSLAAQVVLNQRDFSTGGLPIPVNDNVERCYIVDRDFDYVFLA
ncbi:hypothetical protein CGRA01v4_01766 [Colletotrichum graminicola]|uniref:Uncharacterized protein n=1 Tax=Colletotrichum graminicola (strain M1.001 / M2 / FGSC 10212) TaxID=645133 RepID=E3QW84_COLGM|nr:uncharacterized protein GLRG_10262 [Colletotrichum graminicola M1.001]EFQ35118.1 hypothetical protein GLRG_10262 [Colletotrichum graminicola M1.001]WDK10487.1 hypothetical protein CGRA01v4_01766 [Colletotrichum graminicola]